MLLRRLAWLSRFLPRPPGRRDPGRPETVPSQLQMPVGQPGVESVGLRDRVLTPPVETLLNEIITTVNCLREFQPEPSVDVPPEWGAALQAITAQLDRMESWLQGKEGGVPSSAMHHEKYIAAMWQAISRLRTGGYYAQAIQLWAMARLHSSVRHSEVLSLAESIASATTQDLALQQQPQLRRQILLLGVEACHILGKTEAHACHSLFDTLCIDWSQPEAASEVQARFREIEALAPYTSDLPSTVVANLDFWGAMGLWRGATSIKNDLQQRFAALVEQYPAHDVYRWCKMRVAYEAAADDGVAILTQEKANWSAAQQDSAEELAVFFTALRQAEHVVRRRSHPGGAQADDSTMLHSLQRLPWAVCTSVTLQQHIQPILQALKALR